MRKTVYIMHYSQISLAFFGNPCYFSHTVRKNWIYGKGADAPNSGRRLSFYHICHNETGQRSRCCSAAALPFFRGEYATHQQTVKAEGGVAMTDTGNWFSTPAALLTNTDKLFCSGHGEVCL